MFSMQNFTFWLNESTSSPFGSYKILWSLGILHTADRAAPANVDETRTKDVAAFFDDCRAAEYFLRVAVNRFKVLENVFALRVDESPPSRQTNLDVLLVNAASVVINLQISVGERQADDDRADAYLSRVKERRRRE